MDMKVSIRIMAAKMIHSRASSAHTIRLSARSPTSLTPIARVADGDRGANTVIIVVKEQFGTHLPPSPACPRLPVGTWEWEQWERQRRV